MSNIFITEIVGSNTYAIPTDDTELAAATAGLDLLLGAVLDLTYDRVLAWVEDSGGPGAVEGVRSLNCMIEKFTYLTEECPSESDVDSMIAAIEVALEADSDITSVGNQQVHIFQAGAYFLWNRDASGGFLYPNTPTDDVVVGPFASPAGKWFNDGDLVLGGNTMSGTEVLRVVGEARIEGKLTVTGLIDPTGLKLSEQSADPGSTGSGYGTIWVKDDSPTTLWFTDSSGSDTQLGSGGGSSPWTNTGAVVHLVTATDTVAIGAAAMTGTEKLRVIGNVLVEADGSSLGNINIPAGNALATQGAIYEGGTRLLRRHLNSIYIGNNGYLSATADHNDCIIIGDGACAAAHDTSDRIIALGTDVLKTATLTTGDSLVFGYKAAETLRRSLNSVIIGNNAQQNSAGYSDQNVIIGDKACQTGSASTTLAVSRSVVIGASAGTLLSNTGDLVIIGYSSATAINNLGSYNTIVGALSATRLTSGQYHTILGYQAGRNYNTANQTVAIGYLSMGNSSLGTLPRAGGNFCVAVGSYAMNDWYSSASFATNTAVGYTALGNTYTSATTFVAGTTAIGAYAGSNARNASNCIYLGSYAGQTNTVSERMFIGTTSARAANPLIYGEFDNYLVRVNGKLELAPLTPATKAPFNLAELSAAPSAPVTNDIYLDDGTNTASGNPGWRRYTGAVWEDISAGGGGVSPWTSATGVIYPTTLTDTVAINSTTMSSTADEYLFVKDTDETNATRGVVVELEKDGAGTKTSWTGIEVQAEHSADEDAGTYIGFMADINYGATDTNTLAAAYGFRTQLEVTDGTATCTDWYGLRVEGITGSGTTTNAYGVYINDQGGSVLNYGIYQDGASNSNYFAGQVGVGAVPVALTKLYVQVTDPDSISRGLQVSFNKTATTGQNSFTGVRSTMTYTGDQAAAPCFGFSAEYDFSPSAAQSLSSLYGYSSSPTTGANATVTSVIGFLSTANDFDGSITSYYGFLADTPSVSGSVTNAYGFYARSQGGSTASYGVYIADQYGATEGYGIYQEGYDDLNYFAGDIGIGFDTFGSTLGKIHILEEDDPPSHSANIYSEYEVTGSVAAAWEGIKSVFDYRSTGATILAQSNFTSIVSIGNATGSLTSVNGFFSMFDGTAAGTISFARHFVVQSPLTGTGVISDATGLYIGDMDSNTTTATGIYISEQGSTTGWGIRQVGSDDQNQFEGDVGINFGTHGSALGRLHVLEQNTAIHLAGIYLEYEVTGSNTGSTWLGIESILDYQSTGASSAPMAMFGARVELNNATGSLGEISGFQSTFAGSAAGTCSVYRAFRAAPRSGTSVATTVYGFYADDQSAGSTTAYGVYIAGQGATTSWGIYQAGTDDLNYLAGRTGINQSSLDGTVYLHITDTEDDGTDVGAYVYLPKDGSGSSKVFTGFKTGIWHTGTGTGSLYVGFDFDLNLNNSSASIDNVYGFRSSALATDGTITNYRGVSIDGTDSGGVITNAYGVYIASMEGTTLSYGIYQVGTSDLNYFGGKTGFGTTTINSQVTVSGDVEVGSADAFYMGDTTTDGSWRMVRSGNDLVFQRRESGSWVTKQTISA